MTTSSALRTAWNTKIWTNAVVLNWTDKIHQHDLLIESQLDATSLYDELSAQINFFTCTTARETELLPMGQIRQNFQVRVFYHLQQADVGEDRFNTVIDRLETLDDLVLSSLTSTWNSTVDFYAGALFQEVREVVIDSKRCWRGGYLYNAVKTI